METFEEEDLGYILKATPLAVCAGGGGVIRGLCEASGVLWGCLEGWAKIKVHGFL